MQSCVMTGRNSQRACKTKSSRYESAFSDLMEARRFPNRTILRELDLDAGSPRMTARHKMDSAGCCNKIILHEKKLQRQRSIDLTLKQREAKQRTNLTCD